MLLKIYFYFFINTRGYPWILKYYAGTRITDMRMSIRQIFIQQIGHGKATNHIILVPLTSLNIRDKD